MAIQEIDNLLAIVLTFIEKPNIMGDCVIKFAPAGLAELVDALDSDSSGN